MEPIVIRSGEGEALGGGPAKASVIATSESTNGGFTIADTTIGPGFDGPPPHSHRELTDTFYVVEGTLTVTLADEEVEAGPGDYVCIPPGNVHTFANRSDAPVRFLNINSPAGWENYLRDIDALLRDGPPDMDDWRRVMAKYDFVPAGPTNTATTPVDPDS